jgi:hypothetical protein
MGPVYCACLLSEASRFFWVFTAPSSGSTEYKSSCYGSEMYETVLTGFVFRVEDLKNGTVLWWISGKYYLESKSHKTVKDRHVP